MILLTLICALLLAGWLRSARQVKALTLRIEVEQQIAYNNRAFQKIAEAQNAELHKTLSAVRQLVARPLPKVAASEEGHEHD